MDVTRKPHFGWMALGGLLCLFLIIFVAKVRDGNRATAQTTTPPPAKTEDTPRTLPPIHTDTVVPVPAPVSDVIPAVATIPVPDTKDAPPPPPAIVIPANATVPPTLEITPPAPATSTPLPPISPEKTTMPPPAPTTVSPPISVITDPAASHPSEPPLAPSPGPVIQFRVHVSGETFKSLARKTLGSTERWSDIHKLNPTYRADSIMTVGTVLRLPGDACVQDESEAVRMLPTLRPRPAPRPKAALPLTGTFPVTVDENRVMTLPRLILDQLGNCETVLLSPGSDKCLWLTNQAHLDRLQNKLDKSPAREADVRGFKRLYYAQTVKTPVKDGRILITDKLAAFAGLSAEVVLVGIDDHFELWDAARWRRYTQNKKAVSTEE